MGNFIRDGSEWLIANESDVPLTLGVKLVSLVSLPNPARGYLGQEPGTRHEMQAMHDHNPIRYRATRPSASVQCFKSAGPYTNSTKRHVQLFVKEPNSN